MKWIIAVTLVLGTCSLATAESEVVKGGAVGDSKALIKEWVSTERILSRELRQWNESKSSLNELIALYQIELNQIKEELEAAGDSLVSFDQDAQELKNLSKKYRGERRNVSEKTNSQIARLLALMEYFPTPLLDQVSIDKEMLMSEESELREKVLAMLNVLKSAGRFNQSVNYADEIKLVNGERRQVEVLYLGLATAYYVSGNVAGVGTPANGGWKWQPVEGIQASVTKAIAIYQKSARPELVTLPVEVLK